MRKRLALFLFVLMVPLLSACETPPSATFPELTFHHKQPIRLAVGSIEIINEFRMPFAAPNVEHKMPVAPGPAAERWGRDVLQAAGDGTDKLVMVITDASVIETPLKRKKGLEGAFVNEQSERYEARIAVRLEVRTAENRRRAVAEAFATRSVTIPEDASLADREMHSYRLTEQLLDDFDSAVRPQVSAHLGAFLR
ncbi:hypothetical protein [Nisaea sp.]|uniref:hypothetical protein n=1 Tax=Nisaea sp. TaxID=2024842 RepID=UPI003B521845